MITSLALLVGSDAGLRTFKYTWAAVGIGLLLLVFVLGSEVNGARLSLSIGPISGQPSELLKVILVVFLAGYLSENRALLADESTRIGPISLPPLPYLAPMVAMWAIALGIVVVQRDLGAALLFFAVFLGLLYIATGRPSYVIGGLVLFVAGAFVLYNLFGHVQARVDNWLDPWADPQGAGFQVVQALYAFGRGGILGVGLGAGLPLIGGRLPVPAVHSDYPLAALGEELGLVGLLAILGLYLVLVTRGLRIAAAGHDEFRSLLAAGLALVIGVQAFIIAAGNLKLIPLTGITLPFISYGGSSLLANALVVGLLLALSDRGSEPPPAPRDPQRLVTIHKLTTAVVTLARIAFGVLVGKHAALHLHHQRTGVVLRGDELNVIFLTARLCGNCRGEFGVKMLEGQVFCKHGEGSADNSERGFYTSRTGAPIARGTVLPAALSPARSCRAAPAGPAHPPPCAAHRGACPRGPSLRSRGAPRAGSPVPETANGQRSDPESCGR